MRVGRFGDPCHRIRDTSVPEIDVPKSIEIKGKIAQTITKLEKKVQRQIQNEQNQKKSEFSATQYYD